MAHSPAHMDPQQQAGQTVTRPLANAAPAADQQLLLRRYRVMGPCGTGGFGTVLACWDTRLQRRVAIKRMPLAPSYVSADPGAIQAGESTMEEALNEARTSSQLTHPNIVTVHDFELEDGCAYLVMEYVDGLTLSQILERVEGGTLTPDETSYLVQSLAGALAFAHQHGVLHLDIKPSNIMIDREGTVKLCDFGMATLASATGYAGARGGTVGYMPPEQIRGDLVDERSDIFSLAVVIWQALTGSCPFAAGTAEDSLRLIERGPRIHLSKLVPEATGMAEEAIMQALDPVPSRRLPSVEDFASEVVFGLGDPEAGKASIRGLLGQTEPDDEPDVWDGERLSFAEKHPRIVALMPRAASAAVSAWAAALLIPQVAQLDPAAAAASAPLGAAGIGALTLLWPPAGSLACCVLLGWILVASVGDAASVMAAGFMLIVMALWWFKVARSSQLSSAALMAPACLAAPAAAPAIAGCDLSPAPAAATCALSWLIARIMLAASSQPASATLAASVMGACLASPAALASLAGCIASGIICSAISQRGDGVGIRCWAQVFAAAVLAFSQAVSQRVENGGIWQPPAWDTVGVAVLLCVLLCVAIVLTGERPSRQEVDDNDELAEEL